MDLSTLFSLKDKVALITGASKGIGLGIAGFYAAAGAKVVISSRNQETLEEESGRFQSKGYEVKGIACNVGKTESLKGLVASTIEKYGQIDILVNNAASNPIYCPIQESTLEAYDKIMDVNVKAPFELSKLCLPYLRQSATPSIINISSVGGVSPEHLLGLYSVSKAALISLSKVFAKEWGEYNIRVNVICPGLIKTKFSKAIWSDEQTMEKMMQRIPLKRIGESDEIAALALFLASEASSYSTGGVFSADGGFTI